MSAHQLETVDGRYHCSVCGQRWKYEPGPTCPGVKVYAWGKWPENLLTKKQMSDVGLQTGKKLPAPAGAVHREKSPGGVMWLYDKNQGVPKKQITDEARAKLKAAAEKSRAGWYCPRCGEPHYYYDRSSYHHWKPVCYSPPSICRQCRDKENSMHWAQALLQQEFLVLDTETTGLESGYNEIIQIAVVSSTGETLLDTYVKAQHPERMFEYSRKGRCAHDIHGISPEMLEGAPAWPEVFAKLRGLLKGQIVTIYNASFDIAFLCAHSEAYCLPRLKARVWIDVIGPYAAWVGNWSPYWENYSYPPLNGGHAAADDCRAVIDVIRTMAGVERGVVRG